MASKVIFLGVIAAVVYTQTSAQFSGRVQNLPFGGRTQEFGYRRDPLWGSISQSFSARGFSSPITYNGGIDAYSKAGTGIGGGLAVQPGIGGMGNLRAQAALLSGGNNNVQAFAQHDRYLTKDLKPIGPETNSAGINYINKNNGANAFVSGSQTNGLPARGTVGASIPIVSNKDGAVSVSGQTTFGHGMKPISQVGIEASVNI